MKSRYESIYREFILQDSKVINSHKKKSKHKKIGKHRLLSTCTGLTLLLITQSALSADWDVRGNVELESKGFVYSPAYPQQEDNRISGSISLNPEFSYTPNDDHRILLNIFGRVDSMDDNRSHYDIRELNYLVIADEYEVTIGLTRVFWGVTESRHLIDIINQTDFVENLNGEEKLGQPMIHYNLIKDWGTVSAFVLPGFRERTFPDYNARFSGPLQIKTGSATYESSREEKHIDFALRYTHTIDDWDIGLSAFSGTNREPGLNATQINNQIVLIPHYEQINQFSVDIQQTGENILWKFEGIYRQGIGSDTENNDDFFAAVGGLEYTFYGIAESSIDVGVIAEYLNDNRDKNLSPATNADDDIAIGFRATLNDTQDTQLLAVAMIDRKQQTTFLNIEAERRLSGAWKIELEATLFTHVDEDDIFYVMRHDDHVTARLGYYY